MKIPYNIIIAASGVIVPAAFAFLHNAMVIMVPWVITMFFVIIADLTAGLWKSYKLGIEIRFSRGLRETMGKLLVYFAWVCMVACINVALSGDFLFAKWASCFVIAIELGSIVANLLKPHGINISLAALIKAFLQKSPLPITCEDVDKIITDKALHDIIEEERRKTDLMGTSKSKSSRKDAKESVKKQQLKAVKVPNNG